MTRQSPRQRSAGACFEAVESRTHFAISFLPAVQSPVGGLTVMVAADFNGDHRADVLARGANDGRLHFFAGVGDGRFTPTNAATPINAGPSVVGVVAADFNRDGNLDLAAANARTAASTGGSVAVLLGHGNGTFSPATHYAAGPNPSGIAAGDFNRDGRSDLTISNDGLWPATTPGGQQTYGAGILLANNSGFGGVLRLPLGFPSTAVATMSQNALATSTTSLATNLAFAGPNLLVASPTPVTIIAVVPALVNAVVAPVNQFNIPGENRGIAAADFNRDGRLDVAALQTLGSNSGANTFVNVYTVTSRLANSTSATQYALGGPFSTGLASGFGIAAADFDHDRVGDVVVAGTRSLGPTLPAFTGTVAALAGMSNGSLGAPKTFDVGAIPSAIAAAHVNGDGPFDVITTTGHGISAVLNAPSITAAQLMESENHAPDLNDPFGSAPIEVIG